MRLRRVSFRGLTRFTAAEPVTLDFDSLDGQLVALVGPNGAGKTTALEAAFAALHKFLPSRPGSLYDHCTGRDAFIEATFEDAGHELRARLAIDAEGRKMEGYLTLDGSPISDGKAASFDAEILSRFGSPALLLSSVFAAQTKAGNFLQLVKRDRKALFVELLGLARLQVLHEAAREKGTHAQGQLDITRRECIAGEEEVRAIPDVERELADAETAAAGAAVTVEEARRSETESTESIATIKAEADRRAELVRAEGVAAQALDSAKKALARAEAEPDRLRKEAAEKRRFVEARKAGEMEPAARKRHAEAVASLDARQKRLEEQVAGDGYAGIAQDRLSVLAGERKEIDAAEKASADLGSEYRQSVTKLEAAEAALTKALKTRQAEIDRLHGQAERLKKVPCTTEAEWIGGTQEAGSVAQDLAGTCPLIADARTAGDRLRELEVSPACVEESEALVVAGERAQELQDRVDADLPKKQERAGRREEIATEEEALRKVVAGAEAAARAREDLVALASERKTVDARLETELGAAAEAVQKAAEYLADIDTALAEVIKGADTRLEEARTAHAEALQRHATAAAAASESEGSRVSERLTAANIALSAATKARQDAERRVRESDQVAARCRARLDQLRAVEARLKATREAARAVEVDLGDWTLLADALGRDGIQALEIDAAGPEVARITNELLESCYGPRFSIAFETLREKKSAAGEYVEAFDVAVYDAGAVRPVESLSGGEKVIVGEAVSLAIAIFNSRKNDIRWRTLFRDETSGALDPDNAERYVSMLRRAAALGGYEQVLFVAHLPAVWQAADVQVHVEGGRVSFGAERRAA